MINKIKVMKYTPHFDAPVLAWDPELLELGVVLDVGVALTDTGLVLLDVVIALLLDVEAGVLRVDVGVLERLSELMSLSKLKQVKLPWT